MHRITLITVGKIKTPSIKEAADIYKDRLKHSCDFREEIVSAGEVEDEQKKILEKIEKAEGIVVVLDERGKEFSSKAFAEFIAQKKDAGLPITFVLGGAYGVGDAVRAKASAIFRLSSMTFPHELCQLIFLEQLYRAHEIQKGSGYHH